MLYSLTIAAYPSTASIRPAPVPAASGILKELAVFNQIIGAYRPVVRLAPVAGSGILVGIDEDVIEISALAVGEYRLRLGLPSYI